MTGACDLLARPGLTPQDTMRRSPWGMRTAVLCVPKALKKIVVFIVLFFPLMIFYKLKPSWEKPPLMGPSSLWHLTSSGEEFRNLLPSYTHRWAGRRK